MILAPSSYYRRFCENLILLLILAALFLLWGCNGFMAKNPVPELVLPSAYTGSFSDIASNDAGTMPEALPGPLESEEFDILLAQAFSQNHDLQIRKARTARAKAALEREMGLALPALNASLGTGKTKNHALWGEKPIQKGSTQWTALVKGSYNLDIWGRARFRIRAERERYLAALQEENRLRVDIAGQVAETFVDIIACRKRQDILAAQIRADEGLLELVTVRFSKGQASFLDVSQQRASKAGTLALKPMLEKESALLLGKLSLLLGSVVTIEDGSKDNKGSFEHSLPQILTRDFPETAPLPAPGIPVDLIQNRHDIQTARHELLASQWQIAAAKADFLPSFTLSGQALFSSGSLDLLFQNWVLSLGANLAATLFDGGVKKSRIQEAKALVDEKVQVYAKVVAGAIRDVEDALVRLEKEKQYLVCLENQKIAQDASLEAARLQYTRGQDSFLNYLVAWKASQKIHRQVISQTAVYIKERIRFYRVMGHDWTWGEQDL